MDILYLNYIYRKNIIRKIYIEFWDKEIFKILFLIELIFDIFFIYILFMNYILCFYKNEIYLEK